MILLLLSCSVNDCAQLDRVGDGIDQNCDLVDGVDIDGDGVASYESGGLDCDDHNPDKQEGLTVYFDYDLDGFGDSALYEFRCQEDADWVSQDGDCDDFSAAVHPEQLEICDFIDNDCDEKIDSEDLDILLSDTITLYPDQDGDGYGAGIPEALCFGTEGYVLNNYDCDDSAAHVAPNQQDIVGDNQDTNCDGRDLNAEACTLDKCIFSFKINDFSQDFVHIPVSSFIMGSPEDEIGRDGDEEQHLVHLSQDFYLMSTEVTQGFYEELQGINPAWQLGVHHPVEMISWNEAADFANLLTRASNQTRGTVFDICYDCTDGVCSSNFSHIQDCTGYRLPTEAEWEYAARAGTKKAVWTENGGGDIPEGFENAIGCEGDWSLTDGTPINQLAWFCLNSRDEQEGHHEVAQKQPNSFGLYDMNGNVWEWVHDDYGIYSGETTDPVYSDNPDSKVVRGGRWAFWARAIRSAERGTYSPDNQRNELGFRLARSSSEDRTER